MNCAGVAENNREADKQQRQSRPQVNNPLTHGDD
jgi:hypothetical protein